MWWTLTVKEDGCSWGMEYHGRPPEDVSATSLLIKGAIEAGSVPTGVYRVDQGADGSLAFSRTGDAPAESAEQAPPPPVQVVPQDDGTILVQYNPEADVQDPILPGPESEDGV